jgi:hypothetical protein
MYTLPKKQEGICSHSKLTCLIQWSQDFKVGYSHPTEKVHSINIDHRRNKSANHSIPRWFNGSWYKAKLQNTLRKLHGTSLTFYSVSSWLGRVTLILHSFMAWKRFIISRSLTFKNISRSGPAWCWWPCGTRWWKAESMFGLHSNWKN